MAGSGVTCQAPACEPVKATLKAAKPDAHMACHERSRAPYLGRWSAKTFVNVFIVYNEQRDTLAPASFPQLENRAFIVKVNRLFRF